MMYAPETLVVVRAARGGRAPGVADGHAADADLTGVEAAVAVEVVVDRAADACVALLGEEVVTR